MRPRQVLLRGSDGPRALRWFLLSPSKTSFHPTRTVSRVWQRKPAGGQTLFTAVLRRI